MFQCQLISPSQLLMLLILHACLAKVIIVFCEDKMHDHSIVCMLKTVQVLRRPHSGVPPLFLRHFSLGDRKKPKQVTNWLIFTDTNQYHCNSMK